MDGPTTAREWGGGLGTQFEVADFSAHVTSGELLWTFPNTKIS